MSQQSQRIKCRIESCRFNSPDHFCELKSIVVAPCRASAFDNVSDKSQSMCSNFEEKDRSMF